MKKMPPLILLFFLGDLALALLYLINWGLHQPFHKINLFLDLDGEANLPAWYSSMQLFLIAGLLAVFAYIRFNRKDKTSWRLVLLPIVFVVLSLDEAAKIHEWLGGKTDVFLPGESRKLTMFWSTGIWMFLFGIPFFLSMLGLIFSLKKYFTDNFAAFKKFLIGLLIFAGSAVGIEMLANFVSNESIGHVIEICFEELGEMLGETFILWAAYELLVSNLSLRFSFNQKL
jgi:hypothetical protein